MAVCSRCDGSGLEPDDRVLGEMYRQARITRGHTLRWMAGVLGWSPSYVSYLEVGRRRWGSKQRRLFDSILGLRADVPTPEAQ